MVPFALCDVTRGSFVLLRLRRGAVGSQPWHPRLCKGLPGQAAVPGRGLHEQACPEVATSSDSFLHCRLAASCDAVPVMLTQLQSSNPVHRSAPSCTVTAICGYDHSWLEPNQCMVTMGTEFLDGAVAVPRCSEQVESRCPLPCIFLLPPRYGAIHATAPWTFASLRLDAPMRSG